MLGEDRSAAGITCADGRVLDFHSLRHSFISNLARAGVSPRVAQALARHSTPMLTFGVYAHLGADDERRALDALPELHRCTRMVRQGTEWT
jgi:integrase